MTTYEARYNAHNGRWDIWVVYPSPPHAAGTEGWLTTSHAGQPTDQTTEQERAYMVAKADALNRRQQPPPPTEETATTTTPVVRHGYDVRAMETGERRLFDAAYRVATMKARNGERGRVEVDVEVEGMSGRYMFEVG